VDASLLPDRYRRPERIAHGGMGEIYRAEDAQLERTVAIKVLANGYANDESVRERFTREALAAARLSRAPSTVTIFDVGEHEGRPYIVMEYLAGGSLADRLTSEGAQPLGRTLAWLGQAAAALDAAHEHGIVHRDVKPANLLLDDEGRVHVADFGVASAAHLGAMTETGTVVGTAGYLSPEQARGERATAASDRYALAVVAFELLTGQRPFARDSATAEALAHVSAPIPPASQLRPDLPRQVDAALARGLAKAPGDRYASAAELVDALRAALDDAAGATRIAPAVASSASPPRRRLPVLPLLGVLLFGAGVVAAALLAGRDGETATPPSPPAQTIRETVVQTVTTPAPTTQPATTQPATTQPATTEPATTEAPPPASASELNDQGFALMQAGDYEGALPLLEQAVQLSSGSGELVEAYASYNLAFTRLSLGSCDGVLDLLQRSEEVQGRRGEIRRLQREAERACGGDDGRDDGGDD
jgi:eukaryotic-like serine/threonine-protein kinase